MINRLQVIYNKHQNFILLLILFVVFRALTLLAYRPGGLVLDFSDFYFYREFAQLDRQGYIPYKNLWTTYPPLFPVLMIWLWKISVLLPPWEFNNLWFTLLLGGAFLFFESGNFILLYLMALKIYPIEKSLKPAWIYAALFGSVYTLTGWFESYPLFFFLLSLYLLLESKPYLSALFSGVGFMIKLIPLILLPIGAKFVPAKSERGRLRMKALNIDFDLGRIFLFGLIFAITVGVIGYPFYRMNPALILTPLQLTGSRPPWETVWALLEGNYTYGIIHLDMRNLNLSLAGQYPSSLPWLWISLAFGLLYAFLYTRRINWQKPKAVIAFTGLTLCLFFLYSKGYSPQWVVWLLIFIPLLLPNLRGVIYAVILSIVNIIEANIFFIMFPAEHWLLAAIVLIRSGLIVILAFEYGLIVWPDLETPTLVKIRRNALLVGLILLLLGVIPAANRLRVAYLETRLEQSPYRATVAWLREQPVTEAILLNNHTTYDWFYPYLRHSHHFFMLDDYPKASTPVEAKTTRLLEAIAGQHQALWIYDSDPTQTTPAEAATTQWLANKQPAHQADIDGGRLYLYILDER
jgi:hypothetical protein